MAANELLAHITRGVYLILAVKTLYDYLRHQDRMHFEIFLMFGNLALIVLTQLIGLATGGSYAWLGPVSSILLLAHPYLLLRLVHHLHPINRILDWFALAGMIISWLLILFVPAPLPAAATLAIVAYFVIVEVSATFVLIKGARNTSGVTQRRLLLAAGGSFFIAGVLLIAGITTLIPRAQDFLSIISQFFSVLSGVSFYLGFATPGWLRRAWQFTELHRFLNDRAERFSNERINEIFERLCRFSKDSVGAGLAEAVVWDETDQQFKFIAASQPEGLFEAFLQDDGKIQSLWEKQQPDLLLYPHGLDSETTDQAPGRVRAILAAPIMIRERPWGLLLAYLQRAPLFSTDDLSLLNLYARQTSFWLGYNSLLTDQESMIAQLKLFNDRLRTVNKIDRAILAARSPQQIAKAALTALRRQAGGERASVALFDFENGLVHYLATDIEGDYGPSGGVTLPLSELSPVAEEMVEHKKIIFLENAADYQPAPPLLTRLIEQGIKTTILTPLIAEGQVIGTMALSSTQPGTFKPEDQEITREVADLLAITIQQARLREELTRNNQELERRVAERTAELKATNKELEAFAYSVSHDLRAPLRSIDGFSRVLITNYTENLPEEAHRYLQLVRDNTQQMGELIDDLLSFSRLSRQSLTLQMVEPALLVRAVLKELIKAEPDRKFEVQIGDLAVCRADPSLLRQVFVNLLTNAIKFTRPREVSRIEIGSTLGENEIIYYVKDNGVGFEMEYVSKLFGVFQRLHRAEDFEGTGVGLAIIQRIIHRHGGRVWAESAQDKGAVFSFSLPIDPQSRMAVPVQEKTGQPEMSPT